MNKQYLLCLTIVLISLVIITLLIEQNRNVTLSAQLSIVGLYTHVGSLHINGSRDPPCPLNPNIYVCSGYCPWHNTQNKQLVTCNFLPRISHPDFVKHNIYCIPYPDHCPTYNAWLKDSLPLTRQLIKRIPDHLLSNFYTKLFYICRLYSS